MPNYDYICTLCDHIDGKRTPFEARVAVAGQDWDVVCPRCGDNHYVERLPSAPSFKLVGKGFHAVDYPKGRK